MEPKISLSLCVQGAQLLTPEFCEKNPLESYNVEPLRIEWRDGKQLKHETLSIVTRKNRLITQHININKDAYEHMLATPVEVRLTKKWKTMPKKDRLKMHFDLIAKDLNAVSYTYEVLDD